MFSSITFVLSYCYVVCSSLKQGCKAFIHAGASDDGQKIVIKKICEDHNHEVKQVTTGDWCDISFHCTVHEVCIAEILVHESENLVWTEHRPFSQVKNEMQSVQCLHSTNSDQRRNTWLNGTGFTQSYLKPTRLSTNGINEPSSIHLVSIHQMALPKHGGTYLDQVVTEGWWMVE